MRSSGAGPSLSPSWCWLVEAVLFSSINEHWSPACHRVRLVQPQPHILSLLRSCDLVIYLLPTRCTDVEVPVTRSAAKVFA